MAGKTFDVVGWSINTLPADSYLFADYWDPAFPGFTFFTTIFWGNLIPP